MGWAVVTNGPEGFRLLRAGTIAIPTALPLPQRLVTAHQELRGVMERWEPSLVAIEAVYSKGAAPGASFSVSAAQTIALLVAGQKDLPCVQIAATTVKKAIAGNGRAGKAAVAQALHTLFGIDSDGLTGHATDAAAIALAGCLATE